MSWYSWKPYIPVAVRQARALSKMEKLRKKGLCIQPVKIEGRQITRSFWGQAWCDHLEKFGDYENRLPRGRAYIRNGSVCHLEIGEGAVKAMVSGSEIYNVNIAIKKLPGKKWAQVKKRCAGQIGSLLELLQGRLSKSVMTVVTDRDNGLFPLPGEISLHCSCPDWAVMCKHVAAVLYGVGARLDEKPELLFLLRGVDHEELISADAGMAALSNAGQGDGRLHIAESDLSHLFGIEMTEGEADAVRELAPKRPASVAKARKVPSKNPTTKGKPSGKRITVPKNEDKSFATKALDRGFSQRPPKKNRAGTKKAVPDVPKTLPLTGDAVVKLRKKLNMTKAQLARILDVSPVTIGNWEKSEGPLKLRARTRKAWDAVSKLKNKS
jgi:uncharacterized Zn finger protein/DNA-binding transcriptional regulator YiaG